MGMVAARAHQKGKTKSATRPAAMKVIQKTLRCMAYSSSEVAILVFAVEVRTGLALSA